MFCFLPMPMKSGLSVHVNGHFLVDDSRKHLEKIHKEKLSWNELLSANVIAPCYVDMLLHAQQMTDGGEAMADWFYNLFPKLSLDGEVGNLRLPESVYRLLHKKNPAILLQKHPENTKWLTLSGENKGYFFHSFLSKETGQEVRAPPQLHHALVQLGMPVCTAEVPQQLHENMVIVNKGYTALVKPELIVQCIKKVPSAMQIEDVLTVEVLKLLLEFIIAAKQVTYLQKAVSEVPLLQSYDNRLWKGKRIFKSEHALLLPHCSGCFILQELEKCSVGATLASSNCGIIVDLTVQFVHEHIELFDIELPVKVADMPKEKVELVCKLWSFLKNQMFLNIRETILKYFRNKPLIPADDDKLYPMTLSATVLCGKNKQNCNIWNALKRMGYPNLSFKTLQIEMSYAPGLVNACSRGDDIIQCLKLKAPPDQDAELTPSQVRCIIESVREHPELTSIRDTLQNLKIFETVSGAFVSMKTNLDVFVVPQGVPRYGIERIQESCRKSYVILNADDDYTMKFYQQILSFIEINEIKFYRKVVLPHLHQLGAEDIQYHLRHIHFDDNLRRSLKDDLKEINFIKMPRGELCKIGQLCDPNVIFFVEFCADRLLPDPWKRRLEEWLPLFKELGFKHEVSEREWIDHCKYFAQNSSDLECQVVASRSKVLLDTFLSLPEKGFLSYAKEISSICFIHNNDYEPGLIRELNALFCLNLQVPRELTCFRGSVLSSDGNLAALCKRILPLSCNILETNKHFCQSLGIEFPVAACTVVCNLKEVESHYTCIQQAAHCSSGCRKIRDILLQHFRKLDNLKLSCTDIDDLKETLCVSVSESRGNLALVRPSQLVRSIPSDIDLSPFYYQVPPDLTSCQHLLGTLAIPQEIEVQHCVNILKHIYHQLEQTKKSHYKFTKIALYSYKQLVCALRKGEHDTISGELYLPSEDDELVPCKDLLFNDAPWFSQRLGSSSGEYFKFLKLPPPNESGEKVPPDSLGVANLTSVVSEVLHNDMNSEIWTCNKELCYARDTSKPRCQVVYSIYETLKSKELKDGVLRVYYSERRERPPQHFEDSLQILDALSIRCVTSDGVQTVLKRNGETVKGSESSDKACFVLTNSESTMLVIAPHGRNFNEMDIIQSLSKALRLILRNEIKNEAHLMTMLKCDPKEIERELDKSEVLRYDPKNIKETKYTEAGEEVSLDTLVLRDCLLILNYNVGEIVHYYDPKHEILLTAKVLGTNHGNSHQETLVTLSTKQDSSEESCVQVSPACIFKILTPPQQILLFSDPSKASSAVVSTAEPVHLLPDPEDIITSSAFFSGVPQELMVMRLAVHKYYLKNKQNEKQSAILNKPVVPFLGKIISFLRQPSWQSLAERVLAIVENDLSVPVPMEEERRHSAMACYNPYDCVTDLSTNTHSSVGAITSPGQVHQQSGQTQSQHYNASSTPSSRFQSQPRRRGHRSYHRQQRFRYQDNSEPLQPPPPQTSPELAQIWLDQAKVDFKAALFLMGSLSLSPVVVPPPEQCRVEPEVVPVDAAATDNSEEETDEDEVSEESSQSVSSLQQTASNESVISSLNSSHLESEGDTQQQRSAQFPSVVCFLCHEAVEKCIKGVMYAYCGLDSDLLNCSALVTLHDAMKTSPHSPKLLHEPIEHCVMQVNEHQNRSRYPNFHIPPCAPAVTYTTANAREALMATKKLFDVLKQDEKMAHIIHDIDDLHVPQFMPMLRSLGGNDGQFCPLCHCILQCSRSQLYTT